MPHNQPQAGKTMADVLALPDHQCRLVTWLMREGERDLDAVAANLEADMETARDTLAELEALGFVAMTGRGDALTVSARVGRHGKRLVPGDLWRALDNTLGEEGDT